MPLILHPTQDTTLLVFLRQSLSDWRPKTIKERLTRRCIRVNGEVVTHHAFELHEHDTVEIHRSPVSQDRLGSGIQIVHEDAWLIGVNKPEGLLSVGTTQVRSKHALAIVREGLGPREKLWPVHRLDRETSGVLLFARSREICDALQRHWSEVEKVYAVVVEGHPTPPDGRIDQPLHEDKGLSVRVSSHPDAKPARTRYKTLDASARRSLVEVVLETGRRHQIRAHLAWLGNPVVGDDRYGEKSSRMALHARQLAFTHPVTNERICLKTETPPVFSRLLGPSRNPG
jgi:23S rRNA pseudouridine1911/1915/1917 synthase